MRALMAAANSTGAGPRVNGQLSFEDAGETPAAEQLALALTEEQELAVARRSGPLALSAAAGSGKTSVLVERFVRAVREDAIAPARILAITFTERAAAELRSRVRARLLALGEREAARDTEAAFVGTFHGFCARLLRSHALAAGLDPEFAISDEGHAGRARELAFRVALRDFLDVRGQPAVDVLAAYGVDRARSMIEGAYAELRSRGQRVPRLPAPVLAAGAPEPDVDAAAKCALLGELLERFGIAYGQLERERGIVDFDDLELLAGELLAEHERLRAAWSERFELLMVDEFQDTNPRQLAILRSLDRGNLFTVGDELQSIYGFRHADVRLFRARTAELRGRGGSLELTRNFRSRVPLLEVVNAIFGNRFAGYTPLRAGRADAATPAAETERSAAGAEPLVELLLTDTNGWEELEDLAPALSAQLPRAQAWRHAEARALAARVAALIDEGQARAGDVVLLLRATGDLEVYEQALQLHGLRTVAAVGAFWGHQQIADLISYLRALANPLDEEALYGALASPLAGCSRDCLALLAAAARTAGRPVWEVALALAGDQRQAGLAPGDREALERFCARLQRERATAPRRTISALIERSIDASRYREHVLSLDWGARRLANVHKLLRLARRFEASEGRDLRGFLDHVEYLTSAAKVEPDAPVEGVEPDAVRLMTIHAAKGLEFPVVCLADLGRQPNTQTPDLLVDGDRLGLRLMRLGEGGSRPALDYEELCRERRERDAEEEDRILYVAMTRARERLLLSGAVDFERWPPATQGSTPIAWLGPALAADLPGLVRAREQLVHDVPVGPGGAVSVRCRLNVAEAVAGSEALLPDARPAAAAEASASPSRAQQAPGTAALAEEIEPRAARTQGTRAAADVRVERLSALSYSSLSELERCGYRFYLERVLGLSEDRAAAATAVRGGLDARARGTLVHRLMESLDFARPRAPSQAQVADCARELGLEVGRAERAEVAALIANALGAGLLGRLARAASLRREHPFAFSLGARQPLVTGVIDLLASEPDGGSLVLDYKSDRVAGDVELAALVESEYGAQRLLYALAVLRDGGPSVEVVHWFLERPQEWIAVRYAAAERPALERQLSSRIGRAAERGFRVSANPHRGLCLTCPGRTALCSWAEAETLRELPRSAATAGSER
jgi:ATP-dependent helicase/nuclease subunit A